MDCKGERITKQHLAHLEAAVSCIWGHERSRHSFWITRTDLLQEFVEREYAAHTIGGPYPYGVFAEERYHEPSFDLYLQGEYVPIGRIINVEARE